MRHLDGTPDPAHTPTPITPLATRQSNPRSDDAVWPLLVLLLVLVSLVIGVGLFYIAWQHPTLATPLAVATGGVTVLATVALGALRR